jgi:hypothetical protein
MQTRRAAPLRSQLTSRLFTRSEQRQQMVRDAMRASAAEEAARRRRFVLLLSLVIAIGAAASVYLVYLFVNVPAH